MTASDAELRERAARVIPGGMYGHLNAALLAPAYPQFFERGEGCRQWDVDGREYIDFMCSWGPIVLGHRASARWRQAAARQLALGDCLNGPGPIMVELAELLVDLVPSADWAMFSKNGTDATTQALMVARAATGRTKVLMAHGAYHGADPWCTPGARPGRRRTSGPTWSSSTTTTWRALEAAAARPRRRRGGDHRHPVQARRVRGPGARRSGVRAGHAGAAPTGSAPRWSSTTCARASGSTCAARGSLRRTAGPDRVVSKAMANGYADRGGDRHGRAARRRPRRCTRRARSGSPRWPMAAAKATIETLRDSDGIAAMERAGTLLREGLAGRPGRTGSWSARPGRCRSPG